MLIQLNDVTIGEEHICASFGRHAGILYGRCYTLRYIDQSSILAILHTYLFLAFSCLRECINIRSIFSPTRGPLTLFAYIYIYLRILIFTVDFSKSQLRRTPTWSRLYIKIQNRKITFHLNGYVTKCARQLGGAQIDDSHS